MVGKDIVSGVADRFLHVIEDNADIKWEEEGKEFILNGEMYDVVKIKKINKKTYFYCLNDKKEEQLLKNFAKSIKSSGDRKTGKNNRSPYKFQITDKYVSRFSFTLPLRYTLLHVYFDYKTALVSGCDEINVPPPRV